MRLRKNPLILLSCMSIYLFAACKKEDHAPPPPAIPKIKTVTAGKDIRTYYYDSKGRVTRIDLVLYGQNFYNYTDTGIVENSYDTTNTLQFVTIYKLNGQGLATTTLEPSLSTDRFSSSFTTGGQLQSTTEIRTIPNDPLRTWNSQYHYTNNNLDSVVNSFTEGSATNYRTDYYDEYFTDKTNTIGNDNYGQSFLGASSKNPIKAARDIGTDGNGNQPQTTYLYEYDSLNRITRQTQYLGTSSFGPISFSYY